MWGVGVLQSAMPASIPRLAAVGLDLRVLLVSAASAVATGLVCGVAPALQLSRPNLSTALREGGRSGTAGASRQRLRSVLLVAEVALAVVLLVGAGLFVSSFVRLISVDLGIDHRNVVVAGVNPRIPSMDPEGFERARAQTQIVLDEVLTRLRATPGVESVAAIASGSPLSGSWRSNSITVPGKPTSEDEVQIREVTPEYADVVRVTLRHGRYLNSADTPGAPLVVVLNEEAVRRYFDGQDPIGTIVNIDEADRVVVGVVANVHVRGPEVPVSPEAYLPMAQEPTIGASVLVRAAGDPLALAPVVRTAILTALPEVPVTTTTLEATLRALTDARRFNMLLVGLFGVLAVVIATVGIYGVMAYIVAQRTQEIGVRMALGARPQRVLWMVLGRATTFMAAGLALGLAGAWLLAGTVEAFLFAVQPHDPVVFASVGALLATAGILASLIPALRAARVDPIIALRAD
jgi:predicted permease